METRRRLAVTAFRRTAAYDTTISAELASRYGVDDPPATAEDQATIAGADTSGESISTKLLGDAAVDSGALSVSGTKVNGTVYNFIWSDNSAIPHNDTDAGSTDWTNGRYVKVLPSDAQTMTRS